MHDTAPPTPTRPDTTVTIYSMPSPNSGPGRPKIGIQFALAIPEQVIADADALVNAGEYRKRAEVIRAWLTVGHDDWAAGLGPRKLKALRNEFEASSGDD